MRKIKLFLLTPVLLLVLGGCKIDPRYDLSKLNTEMTLMRGTTFPVPSPENIYLKDIIQLDGFDYIITDDKGDYYIRFNMGPVQGTVTVPESMDGNRVPIDFRPYTYAFGSIPDFLSSGDQNVEPDLSEMEVYLNVQTDLPVDVSVSTTVETLRNGTAQRTYVIDNLFVPAYGIQYCLKEDAAGDPYIVVIPELGKLLSPIPDALCFKSLDVFSDPVQFARLTPGDRYEVACSATVRTPICFSADTRFHASIPIDAELNLEQIGLKRAILYAFVENMIPLDFTMALQALDVDGKPIDSIRFSNPEDNIIRGNGNSYLAIELASDSDIRFSSLVLNLTASSNPGLAGYHFNVSQGFRFDNMYIELPDGIQVRLDE